jgi:hypothetical protein
MLVLRVLHRLLQIQMHGKEMLRLLHGFRFSEAAYPAELGKDEHESDEKFAMRRSVSDLICFPVLRRCARSCTAATVRRMPWTAPRTGGAAARPHAPTSCEPRGTYVRVHIRVYRIRMRTYIRTSHPKNTSVPSYPSIKVLSKRIQIRTHIHTRFVFEYKGIISKNEEKDSNV